jgi:ABC-type Fe3+ transport system substrate-binding protein
MTLQRLDTHITKYLKYLQQTKSFKGVTEITYRIKQSKKSNSIYVKLYVTMYNKIYTKTLRISDHPFYHKDTIHLKYKGVVLTPNKELSKREIKYVEALLRKEIQKLIYGAGISTVLSFKADA